MNHLRKSIGAADHIVIIPASDAIYDPPIQAFSPVEIPLGSIRKRNGNETTQNTAGYAKRYWKTKCSSKGRDFGSGWLGLGQAPNVVRTLTAKRVKLKSQIRGVALTIVVRQIAIFLIKGLNRSCSLGRFSYWRRGEIVCRDSHFWEIPGLRCRFFRMPQAQLL